MFYRRLYFVIPDEPQAVKVVYDLEASDVARQHIHAIAGKGAILTQLPSANERQRLDAASRLEHTVWAANLVLFFLALAGLMTSIARDSSIGSVLSVALMALTFVAGALFAIRVPDTHLDEFRGALSHGEVLLMVDVPKQRVAEIEELVERRHPEATAGGTGWTIEALHI
jgi:hypothetical protein